MPNTVLLVLFFHLKYIFFTFVLLSCMQHAVASIFRLREIESFVHDCESKYLDARLKVTAQHRTE